MSGGAAQIAVWAAALIVATLLGFWGVLWLRRRMLRDDQADPLGMTLADLRRLHASGELSDEEFDAARLSIIGRAGATAPQGLPPARDAGFSMRAEPGRDLTGEPLPGAEPDRPEG